MTRVRIDVQQNAAVTFTATPGKGDRTTHAGATLARNEATFRLYDGVHLDQVHPDLIALAALATFYPWIGERLEMASPVSRQLAETVKDHIGVAITRVSNDLAPRSPRPGSRPGLAFSAGVDSLAALAVMPHNTVPLYSYRSAAPDGRSSMYKADAALHAIEQMNKTGQRTYLVESDLEWVREPVGFPVDASPAVPLILLADWFNLDAIAFGTIAEAAYRTGTGGHFVDYARRGIFTKWQAIFTSAGLEYFNCVAPLSEMGTTKIARESRYGHLAQSCVRGLPGRPCRSCVKCFRKSLIEASFSGRWPNPTDVSRMMAHRDIKTHLTANPIRLQVVLMSALAHYDGADRMLCALQDYVGATDVDTSFTHAFYGPGIDAMVPSRYRADTVAALSKYVPRMTDKQQADFEAFDIRPLATSRQEAGAVEQFARLLEKNDMKFHPRWRTAVKQLLRRARPGARSHH